MASERIFAVNPAAGPAPTLRRNAVAPAPAPQPAPAPTFNSSTTMKTNQTPQSRDFNLLAEVAALTVNRALTALKANDPVEAAAALRDALDMADRLVTTNAAALVANARQTNEFHGYSINDPFDGADAGAVRKAGGYDLNNP